MFPVSLQFYFSESPTEAEVREAFEKLPHLSEVLGDED
jgi:hypothetical protein